MKLQIVSQLPESRGRVLRPYKLDGIDTVGVFGGEPFAIRFKSNHYDKIQVRLSVDGTDVATGEKANLNPYGKGMWVVRPSGSFEMVAWPETTQGGAAFVFTTVENSVAAHTHGDISAKGYISLAIFTEGRKPQYYPRSDLRGLEKGGLETTTMSMGGPAVGAGSYKSQQIGSAQGLYDPKFDQIIQVRYLWWDDLVRRLQEQGYSTDQIHPSGFEPTRMADLGSTPRLDTNNPSFPEYGYLRFE